MRIQCFSNFSVYSIAGAVHAPVAQHRYTPVSVSTQPHAPSVVAATAPPAPTPAVVSMPVQPIVSQPPLRKLRPPPREGEDRAIPIHLVPIRRVDMVPVVAVDQQPAAPTSASVPPGIIWLEVVQ